MATLGDFMGGFQQGSQFSDQQRRNVKIDRALDLESRREQIAQHGMQSGIDSYRADKGMEGIDWGTVGGDMPGLEDPLNVKIKDWFKGIGKKALKGLGFGDSASDKSALGDTQQTAGGMEDTSVAKESSTSAIPTRVQSQGEIDALQEQDLRRSEGRPTQYADGGPVSEEGKAARARMEERRAAREAGTSKSSGPTADNVNDTTKKDYKPTEKPASKGDVGGRAARGRGAAALDRAKAAGQSVKSGVQATGRALDTAIRGAPEGRSYAARQAAGKAAGQGAIRSRVMAGTRAAVNSGVGGAYVGAAGIDAAITGMQTGTDEYERRLGTENIGKGLDGAERLIYDILVRGFGVAGDLANSLTFGNASKWVENISGRPWNDQSNLARVQNPTPVPPDQYPDPANNDPAEEAAGREQVGPTRTAVPGREQAPGPVEDVPIDFVDAANQGVSSEDIPHQSTKDWEKFRAEQVSAMMMQGVPMDQANQAVTNLQHEGFLRYGREASALFRGGDIRAATLALRAGYQYLPNGTDVKFGIQGNNIVGVGFDEKTGERKGPPQVLDPDRLDAMLQNFVNPGAFSAWTTDRAAGELAAKESESKRGLQAAQTDQARAQAEYLRAGAERGGPGAGRGDGVDRVTDQEAVTAMNQFDAQLDRAMLDEGMELKPQEREALLSMMTTVYMALPPEMRNIATIVSDFKKAARSGDMSQVDAKYGSLIK